MINKKELAKRINVTIPTLYNWEKTKPELIKMIENSYKYEQGESDAADFLRYFYELDQSEQELYIAEIKFKALKKKAEKANK
ncbi:TetR/AcrR family transcriptional regulator [Campylobacter curvus]|jgi:cobaltochelatase, cobN subunit|uniref:TetR/AcrR family transcriptional regulator n=1 Tax=Campylobacter curvus TaxID=200 RepID=UPI001B8BDDC9|nr:TetR/AcrR family transcriptional regulator [Campylobacter curvus]